MFTVRDSLENCNKAIDGMIVMSSELESLSNNILDNKVSNIWHSVSYPSLKPLGSWINNLVDRLNFMNTWIEKGHPSSFWISGFYFT